MDRVARLTLEDRRALFTETAARLGFGSPLIVEKDFWVCWVLHRPGRIEGMPRLLFKGGTSLSKCFGLIERFSEDIDLGIEREDIGLAELAPTEEMGSKRRESARKFLQTATQEYVQSSFEPLLRRDLEQALGKGAFELQLHQAAGECIVDVAYPRALDASSYPASAYIEPRVRLELGARSDHHPVRRASVEPYSCRYFPQEFDQPSCEVIAQAPERTLLEKALILHTDNLRGKFNRTSSRHAYDLAMLHWAGTTVQVTKGLFEEVARHKRTFSDDLHAGRAPEQGIRIVPEGELRSALAEDYRRMEEMFFRSPPSFGKIIDTLNELELAIRNLSPSVSP